MAIDLTIIDQLSDEQRDALRIWVEASSKVPGWLDGFGLGRSYIDARNKGGETYGERLAYVRLDDKTARMVPELEGQPWQAIRTALEAAGPSAAPGM